MNPSTGFLRHFHACNRHDLSKFVAFHIGTRPLGWVTKKLASSLLGTGLFIDGNSSIALSSQFTNFATRSEALAEVIEWLSEQRNKPLRNEMYPVIEQWDDEPLAQIDRIAVPWFGIKGFGIHVNGFVRKKNSLHLWIGERAMDRLVDPGKLDNLIGGGQPIGLTLEKNLCKEAKEEAGIEAAMARTAKPVRTLSYMVERMQGLRNDVLFIYDLELPENFIPRNTDGEVAAFHLMSLPEVAEIVRTTDRFKFNCNLVVTDFLVRHGFLGKNNSEYEEIKKYLHPYVIPENFHFAAGE